MKQDELRELCRIAAYSEEQAGALFDLYKPHIRKYCIDCTGDVCAGDEIVFAEGVFTGSYKKPKFSHFELVEGKVVSDSYGAAKQQHTLTIQTPDGKTIRRKGRNVYRYLTLRRKRDEAERRASLEDKHARGDSAREARANRKESWL